MTELYARIIDNKVQCMIILRLCASGGPFNLNIFQGESMPLFQNC